MRASKRAKISWEMNGIAMALEQYKNEFGEYPPDMFDMEAFVRHVEKRWPRLDWSNLPGYNASNPPSSALQKARLIQNAINQTYQAYDSRVDFTQSNAPLGALALWLGGFPNIDGKLSGFLADPENPFFTADLPANRVYDQKVFLDLELDGDKGKRVRIYKPTNSNTPIPVIGNEIRDVFVPLVYFRAQSGGGVFAYRPDVQFVTDYQGTDVTDSAYDWCFPYADTIERNTGGKIIGGKWKNPTTYQLIHPGLDGKFGKRTDTDALKSVRVIKTGANVGAEDLDNIMNFSDYKELKSILP